MQDALSSASGRSSSAEASESLKRVLEKYNRRIFVTSAMRMRRFLKGTGKEETSAAGHTDHAGFQGPLPQSKVSRTDRQVGRSITGHSGALRDAE